MIAKHSLMTFCDLFYSTELITDWILVGSVASILQGADMEPGDVDIYVKHEEDVKALSQLMKNYCEHNPVNLPISDPEWRSSIEVPYMKQTFESGFTWTKGKWSVDSFPLEIVQISNSAGIPDSIQGDGIWEGGKYIWDFKKKVDFGKYQIFVVPLEIQLESNLRRKREKRVKSIISALQKNGYNEDLLRKAISVKYMDIVNDLLK